VISWERPVDKGKRAQGEEEGCLAPQRMRRGNSENARTIRSLRGPRHKTSPSCAGVPQRSNKTIHRLCSSRHWLASSARSKPASALAFPLAPSGLHLAVFLVWMSQGSKQHLDSTVWSSCRRSGNVSRPPRRSVYQLRVSAGHQAGRDHTSREWNLCSPGFNTRASGGMVRLLIAHQGSSFSVLVMPMLKLGTNSLKSSQWQATLLHGSHQSASLWPATGPALLGHGRNALTLGNSPEDDVSTSRRRSGAPLCLTMKASSVAHSLAGRGPPCKRTTPSIEFYNRASSQFLSLEAAMRLEKCTMWHMFWLRCNCHGVACTAGGEAVGFPTILYALQQLAQWDDHGFGRQGGPQNQVRECPTGEICVAMEHVGRPRGTAPSIAPPAALP